MGVQLFLPDLKNVVREGSHSHQGDSVSREIHHSARGSP